MKKLILTLIIGAFCTSLVSAQTNYLPNLQVGIKAGGDYSLFPSPEGAHNKGGFGYIGGGWARFGGAGLFFQPELYATSKNLTVTQLADGNTFINHGAFTNIDVPLLVGNKVGNVNAGFRFYTGPVISFAIAKRQSFTNATLTSDLNYHDMNYAWQLGAGVDLKQFSLDVRYEAGINKVPYGTSTTLHTRLNMVNITLSYSLFSDYGSGE
jgi:Outer membrane protein beta-barrel domain